MMIKQIFLAGPSGLGKTTAILRLLPHVHGTVGGFIVQRVDHGPDLHGFCLTPAALAQGTRVKAEEALQPCFLTREGRALVFHPERFRESFLQLTEAGDLVILDEIGGMELQLPEIRQRLRTLWQSGRPLLGVWKSRENLMRMHSQGGAPAELLPLHHALEQELRALPKTRLLDTIPDSACLLHWLETNGLGRDLPSDC